MKEITRFRIWPATLLKKRLRHRCFLVNFEKFIITPFLRNTSERLLLDLVISFSEFLIKHDCSNSGNMKILFCILNLWRKIQNLVISFIFMLNFYIYSVLLLNTLIHLEIENFLFDRRFLLKCSNYIFIYSYF